MTKICYLLSHGFAARMVLQSDLMDELLKRGMTATILTQAGGDEALRQYARPGAVDFAPGDFRVNKLTHGQFAELRRYFREPMRQNPALWSRHLYNRNASKGWIRRRADLFMMLHRAFHKVRPATALFSMVEESFHKSATIRNQLQELKPSLVVSTYPVSSFESTCLLEARKLGIPTVGHLLSWDNITCKGRFIAPPEHYVSWGPIMTQELKEHYAIEDSRIHECGVPHFDAHLELTSTDSLDRVLVEMGLDPNRPYLFFGMSSPIFAPHEIDIVEWLAERVQEGVFGSDMQLVVRPHPQNVTGFMADLSWLPRLEKLRSRRVGLNMPLLADERLAWNMDQQDLEVLVNLLGGCTVSMNSGSTLSIDALMHDKPVIVTLFDADRELPWWKSAKRIREFPHYAKLLATGGIRAVYDFEQLTSELSAYIRDPARDAEHRRSAIAAECGLRDGKAAERVAESLRTIASAGSVQRSDNRDKQVVENISAYHNPTR